MKLLRLGNTGKEKPAIIDKDGNYRDLSSIVNDFNPETLNFNTIEKIKNTDISNLPKLDSNLRKYCKITIINYRRKTIIRTKIT